MYLQVRMYQLQYVNGNNQWYYQQKLNQHLDLIFCLLLNNNDDLILSGSRDNTIKFWIKQNEWFCQQTINDHVNSVYSIIWDDQQNKLISCSYDKQILVIEYSQFDKNWSVKQKIKIDQQGYRLCFINDILIFLQRINPNIRDGQQYQIAQEDKANQCQMWIK
ncbi:unnamed protein product [Paramecium sonneborni]|uniref:WD40-repeat-containing domain n=1 Tax=Paramecium sonneborni TaxID=65129 RepID=A0A8S1RP53_9CILI|nr:unnamed protein product [Paramecium sonneborni]